MRQMIENKREYDIVILDPNKLITSRENKEEGIIKYIDLFCGLGAFHSAFNNNSNEQKSYECVFACDIDDNVRKIIERILQEKVLNKDSEAFCEIEE